MPLSAIFGILTTLGQLVHQVTGKSPALVDTTSAFLAQLEQVYAGLHLGTVHSFKEFCAAFDVFKNALNAEPAGLIPANVLEAVNKIDAFVVPLASLEPPTNADAILNDIVALVKDGAAQGFYVLDPNAINALGFVESIPLYESRLKTSGIIQLPVPLKPFGFASHPYVITDAAAGTVLKDFGY